MKKFKEKTAKIEGKLKFKISPLLIIMAAIFFLQNSGYLFISYMIAVIFHEFAHAEVANKLGYRLIKFNLNPYGASLIGEFESVKNRDEILIALAGPLANLALIIISVALWWVFPSTYFITLYFVTANIFISFFNLIPVFPLDGGRILLASLSLKMPRNIAYKRMRIFGFILSIFLITAFILFAIIGFLNLTFAITGVFVLLSSAFPDKSSYYQRLYSMASRSKNLKKGLITREILVSNTATILQLTKMLSGSYFTKFIIVDEKFNMLLKINEFELEKLSLNNKIDLPLIELNHT
ncbi:MAG: hypothetical protein FWE03_02215 [Firmicutes bacterium]|nr:hypothetical protein [Bacillota bacterium]